MTTISLKIKGKSLVPANDWHWTINGNQYIIPQNQTSFEYIIKLPVKNGWNSIVCKHTHDDHKKLHANEWKYSFVNITGIYINNVYCKKDLLNASGTIAKSLIKQKGKFSKELEKRWPDLKELGEPFELLIKFYYPLEHWNFALLEQKPISPLQPDPFLNIKWHK